MALRRREALILAGVAAAAAAAGFVAGPKLLDRGWDDADALRGARFLDLSGDPQTLDKWQGKILVLNFWATWCAPCLEEIPMLVVMRDKYASSGVEIVGIAVDLAAKVSVFSKKEKISYPLLLADAGGLELMRKLGNRAGGLPYTVFLDRRGALVRRKLGALKGSELESILAGMLKE
jgi:thiol-disulfide isomerase/thioredoxin